MSNKTAPERPANPQYFSRLWSWLLLGVAVLAAILVPLPAGSGIPQERVFHVQASSFAYAPAVLHANPGDRVTIELVSSDVVHGIYIDGYDLEAIADPGQTTRLSFVAERAGTFRFRCTVSCGALHPFMTGKLQVGTNWLFRKGLVVAAGVALAGLWVVRKPSSTREPVQVIRHR